MDDRLNNAYDSYPQYVRCSREMLPVQDGEGLRSKFRRIGDQEIR